MSSKRVRRGGGRNSGRKNAPFKIQVFDSNGPDVRVRGTASQVFERYVTLARDAASSGDFIAAEGYYQHAEHYHRLLTAINGGPRPRGEPRPMMIPGSNGPEPGAIAGEAGDEHPDGPNGEADAPPGEDGLESGLAPDPDPDEPGQRPH
ncbi:MAG: DUF4167 domain-containing protein [Proteobacteria bacterium]|nr:DUF4167 domain-containing protein [Pseudomonadota bacterium]